MGWPGVGTPATKGGAYSEDARAELVAWRSLLISKMKRSQPVYLRRYSLQSIVKVVLHRRLAAIVLAVALFGANTATASVCEAYCGSVGKKNSDHHHQTAATPSSPHHHLHAQQHRADCPECPKTAGQSSLQLPDCRSFARVQALQENSRVFSDDHALSQLDGAKSSTGSSLAPIKSERFSCFHGPPNISSFQPVLVSLRI
jgi:hypothetical protein